MRFPEAYCNEMKTILGSDAESFFATYQHAAHRGISINTSKISVEDFLKIAPFQASRIPWSSSGLEILDDFDPGKHPYYHAGLYYVQEPSAMLPVELLDLQVGDRLFDACAAPGGKSMQAYARLKTLEAQLGTDAPFLVVACDQAESRAKAILRNAERYGARDFILLREDAGRVARSGMTRSFDKILLDAPCSGEGMFRKDDRAIKSWTENGPEHYSEIQKRLIRELSEGFGGDIVYSTCTFNRMENEEVIAVLDHSHDVRNTRRIYPHVDAGEGHFAALLSAKNTGSSDLSGESPVVRQGKLRFKSILPKPPATFVQFMERYGLAGKSFQGRYELKGEELFLLPRRECDTGDLEVIRRGLLVGRVVRDRKGTHFWPSQALAHYIVPEDYRLKLDYPLSDPRVMKYLRGETLETEATESGYYLVCVDGFALGFASIKNGVFKNLYKQSWRVLK